MCERSHNSATAAAVKRLRGASWRLDLSDKPSSKPTDKPRGRVSLVEVARRAGVSTATAGRALGGYGYASPDIRERVRAAATALGYRPNRLARGLITGRTQTIGVVAGDIESAFYSSAIRSIGDVARAAGFGVIVTNSDEQPELEREAVELLMEKRVDGIIVSPCDLDRPQHLLDAVAAGCAVVQIDRVAAGLAADAVTVDNVGGARQCIARLVAAGHRAIAFLAELEIGYRGDVASFLALAERAPPDPHALYPSWQRLLGYLAAHREAGLPVEPRLIGRTGAYSVAAARSATLELLGRAPRPTALFTADGTMSVGALEAITTLGIAIPDGLSLIGFDDLDWMKFVGPGITAARQPVHEMGRAAAELILARIGGDAAPPRHLELPAQLTERRSVAPPAGTGAAARRLHHSPDRESRP
ncbi:MAG: LacI family DNA-binding transcriptional regulator [Dongiaceae bacterium]